MEKKFIYAGIPVLALFFTMVTPLVSVWGFGANLFNLFKGSAVLAICFIVVTLFVAYCGWAGKFMNWAPYLMLLPFVWLIIKAEGHIGAGAWIYIILTAAEILFALKPDLLDSICGKKKE